MRWQKPGYHCSIHVEAFGGKLSNGTLEVWSSPRAGADFRFPEISLKLQGVGGMDEPGRLRGCWDFVAVEIYSKSLSFGCFCWDLVIFDWCLFCVVLFFWCFCLVVLRLERIQEDVYMMKIVDKLKSCFVFLWCVCYMPVGWFSGCRMSFGILRHTSWVMHSKQGTDWSKALGIFCNIKVSIGQGSCLESVCWLSPCPL